MAVTARKVGRPGARRAVTPARDVLQLVDGRLKLAVVADTHSHPHPRCAERLRAEAPSAILHAGDIGELTVLDELAEIAPLFAVRGNIDTRAAGIPDARTLEVREGERRLLTLVLLHIAVYGPKLRAEAAALARAEDAALVVCGHSHVPFLGRDRGIAIFNPGSVGPRRFTLPILYGVIDIARDRVEIRHVDCETGARWTP
ncbi:MAG: metallophosphoesterase family protein [Polyangiaceae bacterium]